MEGWETYRDKRCRIIKLRAVVVPPLLMWFFGSCLLMLLGSIAQPSPRYDQAAVVCEKQHTVNVHFHTVHDPTASDLKYWYVMAIDHGALGVMSGEKDPDVKDRNSGNRLMAYRRWSNPVQPILVSGRTAVRHSKCLAQLQTFRI